MQTISSIGKRAALWSSALLLYVSPALATAETYPGISQPPNAQSADECEAMDAAWSSRVSRLSSANLECEVGEGRSRSGPSISAKGVRLPNCGYRQQAYMSCANLQDQLCRASKDRIESTRQCYSALSANQKRRSEEETARAKLQRKIDETKSAQKAYKDLLEKGPYNTMLDRMGEGSATSASKRFNSATKEATRSAGSPGADSQPELNRVGEVSDGVFRLVPGNQAIAELGSQSAATARARMADALNQLDGATTLSVQSDADAAMERYRKLSAERSDQSAVTRPSIENDAAIQLYRRLAAERAEIQSNAALEAWRKGRNTDKSVDMSYDDVDEVRTAAQRGQANQDAESRLEILRQINNSAKQTLQIARARQPDSAALLGGTSGIAPTPGELCRHPEVVCSAGQPCRPVCARYRK